MFGRGRRPAETPVGVLLFRDVPGAPLSTDRLRDSAVGQGCAASSATSRGKPSLTSFVRPSQRTYQLRRESIQRSPLLQKNRVDRKVGPLTLESRLFAQVGLLAHAQASAHSCRCNVPRVQLGLNPVHAEVVEGHLHKLARSLRRIAPPVILRVEDPPDLALPVAQVSRTDPDVPDHPSPSSTASRMRSPSPAIRVADVLAAMKDSTVVWSRGSLVRYRHTSSRPRYARTSASSPRRKGRNKRRSVSRGKDDIYRSSSSWQLIWPTRADQREESCRRSRREAAPGPATSLTSRPRASISPGSAGGS